MNWLFFAILAYFIAAIVSTLDKVILSKTSLNPRLYAAWVGIFGSFGFILIPFGFKPNELIERPFLILLGIFAGLIIVFGLYFFFKAVTKNEISRIAPLFGILITVFTLVISNLFLIERLDNIELIAFILLLLGGIVISIKWHHIKSLTTQSISFVTFGAFLFAGSFVALKYVYLNTNFINGFVISRVGELAAGLILLAYGGFGKPLKRHAQETPNKTIGLFIVNKILAGAYAILQNYAFFLGSVVMVQALEGFRYVFILLIATILSVEYPKILLEKINKKTLFIKFLAILLIIIGLAILALSQKSEVLSPGVEDYGVTFSHKAVRSDLDWKMVYLAMLNELDVKYLRLPAYWDVLENSQGIFDYSDLDWQINEATKNDTKIILSIGMRVPRWPECHVPEWANDFTKEQREKEILEIITATVSRYKDNNTIEYWQVENEPFLSQFGICPPFDSDFLNEEVSLVKSLDNRKIIVSDSGELSLWIPAAKRADIFGTTLYRIIYTGYYPGGYFNYPLPPSFFHLKSNLIRYFAGTEDVFVVELQAEPWGPKDIYSMTPEEVDKSLSFEQFKKNIEYTEEVGFRRAYLWGVEWWYSEKLQGREDIWNYAKTLF